MKTACENSWRVSMEDGPRPDGNPRWLSRGAGQRNGFWRNAACLILFCGTVLLFSQVVNHDFLDCDDPDYVTQNSQVQAGLSLDGVRWALTSGAAANWHPLTWLSHMLDRQLLGPGPRGPHATNVLLHALNAVLAFLVLRRLTGSFWMAAFNAALFAWHPLRVESVAWVAERKDLLCGFFGLAAIWAYAQYAERRRDGKPARVFWGMMFLAFLLGLLCKPMLVTLPGLLLVLDWWPLQRLGRETPRRLVLEKVPLLVLSAAVCVVTVVVQQQGGAVVAAFSFPERIANAAVSVASYLGKFFWPARLAVGYPHARHLAMVAAIGPMLLVLGLTGCFFQQRRQRPWLLAGWLWFLGMLVPVLGLVQVGTQAMADRYTYLPLIGVQMVLFGLWSERKWSAWAGPAMAVCILSLLATRTWGQEAFWKNSRTLYEHALAVTPGNYLAESYLGTTCFNAGRIEIARAHFQNAVELRPDFVTARVRLGFALERLGRFNEAVAAYRVVLQDHPRNFEAQLHCAGALAFLDRNAEAVPLYAAAIQTDGRSASARRGLADALRALGRPGEAGGEYRAALALKPDDPFAYFGLAAVEEDLNAPNAALADYLKAAQLKPDYVDAQYNAGVLLLNQGRDTDAADRFRRALQIEPAHAQAQAGLKLAEAR